MQPGAAGVPLVGTARRQIEGECVALSNAFAYHLDHREYDQLVALFAPDGCFVRTGVRLQGRENILRAMRDRPAEQFTRHITTNFHFTHVDHDSARAVFYNQSYFAYQPGAPPYAYEPERMMLLDFVDVYARTDAGWRFLERDARPVFIPEQLRARLPAAAFRKRA
ncbi:MAG: nuclear transport factor 2 family protein [Burkholderiales bacterium]